LRLNGLRSKVWVISLLCGSKVREIGAGGAQDLSCSAAADESHLD
jgi:hypothetical protein